MGDYEFKDRKRSDEKEAEEGGGSRGSSAAAGDAGTVSNGKRHSLVLRRGDTDLSIDHSGLQRFLPSCMQYAFADHEAEKLYREYYENEKRSDFHSAIVICLVINIVLVVMFLIKYTDSSTSAAEPESDLDYPSTGLVRDGGGDSLISTSTSTHLPPLVILFVTLAILIGIVVVFGGIGWLMRRNDLARTAAIKRARRRARRLAGGAGALKNSASSSSASGIHNITDVPQPGGLHQSSSLSGFGHTERAEQAAAAATNSSSGHGHGHGSINDTARLILQAIPYVIYTIQLAHVVCDLWLFAPPARLPPDGVTWALLYTYAIYVVFPLRLRLCVGMAAGLGLLHFFFVAISPHFAPLLFNQVSQTLYFLSLSDTILDILQHPS